MRGGKKNSKKRAFPGGKARFKVTYNVQFQLMRDALLRSTRCNTQDDLREEQKEPEWACRS